MRRVLVADDDPTHLRQMCALLEQERWEPQLARTAEELMAAAGSALAVVEPNISGGCWWAVMDAVAPRMSGCPLIIATSYPSSALYRRAREVRATGFLVKPVAVAALRELLAGEERWDTDFTTRPIRTLAWMEWEFINDAVSRCAGNMSRVARELGVTRQTVYRKMRKHPLLPHR